MITNARFHESGVTLVILVIHIRLIFEEELNDSSVAPFAGFHQGSLAVNIGKIHLSTLFNKCLHWGQVTNRRSLRESRATVLSTGVDRTALEELHGGRFPAMSHCFYKRDINISVQYINVYPIFKYSFNDLDVS
ncbi:hypothetical protein HZS61_009229 [Fusarium oxysporum f. sp. conglutinans]|uniref:Uncharacterized protein n=1 Tax=Fusarium oxysporum f. sp. conglutinans TaxID=100902 RepID=A0A8H6GZ87_FUSOX|nr:hypothetical protein HZS61_009229 [Fusarium oxysporum f. sp. conglutinans]